MNEITHIHLGRQPYTISVEAHKLLKAYLADISAKVSDKSVVDEVELRMSELLTERGVSDDKVILAEDIAYLKSQLGDADDFSDEDDQESTNKKHEKSEEKTSKRLFRDREGAMLAGVSSGLANFLGLDVVIIRILFVLFTIFGSGAGLVVYVVLWLVMPEAKSTSEKLQMKGKPVTLEALKESVSQADAAGAVQRASSKIAPAVNHVFQVIMKVIGAGFILAGFGLVFVVGVIKTYMILHNGQLFQENLFPVGDREQWLFTIVMALVVIVAVFVVLIGIQTFTRKWPLHGWITGILIGLFFIGTSASFALAADTAPRVKERYEAMTHTSAVQSLSPFERFEATGGVDVVYIPSPTYAVSLHYTGDLDPSKVKFNVKDGTLYIDGSAVDTAKHCTMLCLFPRYNLTVQLYAPNLDSPTTPRTMHMMYPQSIETQ